MMTTVEILKSDHYLFASEVVCGLNRFYGIPIKLLRHSDDDYFFNNDIRWGIATICYLFRKDFLKIFNQLKESLKYEKQFKKYCMLISVSKNDRYFFNFLRRVALIYEMAVYCYRNGSYYFAEAQSCIARYQDKEYFQSAGSWPKLTKTASFLRELGNPFLLVILEESSSFRHPLRFSATVERIERRLKKKDHMCILDSKEMCFLRQQKEKIVTRAGDEKKTADSHIEKERAFSQCLKSISCKTSMDTPDEGITMKEKQAIIEYLGSLLLSEVSNKFHKKKISSERTCCNATDSFKPCDKHFQSNPNSDDQWKEKEGSSIRNDETSFDIKCPSLLKRFSDKSKNENTETHNSKFNEGDMISQGSSSSDENSQLQCIYSINGIYSSMESITSGSLLFSENIDSSGNESSSLDPTKNEFLLECSSENENAQENRNKNNYLDTWKDSQHSSSSNSNTESSTAEFENTHSDVKFSMNLLEEGVKNRARMFSEDVYIPENVHAKQSIVSDEKRGNENPIDDKEVLSSKLEMGSNSLTGTYNEVSRTFRITLKHILVTKIKTIADKSETNLNTNVDNSLSNSHPQHIGGKKNRRKKKGKRK